MALRAIVLNLDAMDSGHVFVEPELVVEFQVGTLIALDVGVWLLGDSGSNRGHRTFQLNSGRHDWGRCGFLGLDFSILVHFDRLIPWSHFLWKREFGKIGGPRLSQFQLFLFLLDFHNSVGVPVCASVVEVVVISVVVKENVLLVTPKIRSILEKIGCLI